MTLGKVINKNHIKQKLYFTGQADQIRRSSRSVCLNLREAWLPARRG